MDEKHSQLWQKLSAALKPQVSPDTFKRWFSAVKLVQATDEALTFRVPNNIYQFWIESNHMAALQAAIVTALGAPRVVNFSTGADGLTKRDDAEVAEISAKEFASDTGRDTKQSSSALGLNPRNNFESFVVGPNNEIGARREPGGRQTSGAHLHPAFHLWGGGIWQDAPDAG